MARILTFEQEPRRGDRLDHRDKRPVRLICGEDVSFFNEDALDVAAFASLVIRHGSSALLRGASIRP